MIPAAAKAALEAAGYFCELANSILYVRQSPHSMPDRLYVRSDGEVSDIKFKVLLNRKKAPPQ